MFDDMDWDMEAAADQEEEFLSGPPADEDDWCFGVPPEDLVEPESVEDPHEPIACGDAEAEGPSEVQKEPAPVQLPIAENASIPEIGKFRRLNTKTTDARDWPVRVSPSPAGPAKAAVPEAEAQIPEWWRVLDFDQRVKHVEGRTRHNGWKQYQRHLQARGGQDSRPIFSAS